jgi:hypothetical protein
VNTREKARTATPDHPDWTSGPDVRAARTTPRLTEADMWPVRTLLLDLCSVCEWDAATQSVHVVLRDGPLDELEWHAYRWFGIAWICLRARREIE